MDKIELVNHLRDLLNSKVPVAYIKYRVNPPTAEQYFPDKWELGITDQKTEAERVKHFLIDNFDDAAFVIEKLTGAIPDINDYSFQDNENLFIELKHN